MAISPQDFAVDQACRGWAHRRQFVVRRLPQEPAGLGIEGHHDTLVASDALAQQAFVVGPNVDDPFVDDRTGIGLGAEFGAPQDVLATRHIPIHRCAGLSRDHHVP